MGVGFVAIDEFCYAAVSGTFSWLEANKACKSLHKDAQLVVVSSAEKQETVKAIIPHLGIRVTYFITSPRSYCDRACLLVGLFVPFVVISRKVRQISMKMVQISVTNFSINFLEVKVKVQVKNLHRPTENFPVVIGYFHQIWQSDRINFGMKYRKQFQQNSRWRPVGGLHSLSPC